MTKLLLKTTSNDEMYDADIKAAYVQISQEQARKIIDRIELFRLAKSLDKDLWEMYFWDYSVSFLDKVWADPAADDYGDLVVEAEEIEAEIENLCQDLGNKEFLQLAQDYQLDFDKAATRTECDQMIVREDEVCWTAIPRHTSIYITTGRLSLTDLQAIANQI